MSWHTPGPWNAAPSTFGEGWVIRREFPCVNGLSAWFGIATVYAASEGAEGYTDGSYCAAQIEPTARLIAEAPAMAEALETALVGLETGHKLAHPDWDGTAKPGSAIGDIRAILARIKGVTP